MEGDRAISRSVPLTQGLTVLHLALKHLGSPITYAGLLCIYLSSAFNTIHSHVVFTLYANDCVSLQPNQAKFPDDIVLQWCRSAGDHSSLVIYGYNIRQVSFYNYLQVHDDGNLTGILTLQVVVHHHHFLPRLRFFGDFRKRKSMFYEVT